MTTDIIASHEAREHAKRQRNQEALARRLAEFNARTGPRVGDYIRLPDLHPKLGKWTRFTHHHGDLVQTGGGVHSSYYLGHGYLSYSGGLDRGVKPDTLLPTAETKDGSVWFFDGEQAGAGRGVDFMAPMRVFTLREGADIRGISELECPFSLNVLDEEMRKHWREIYGSSSGRDFYQVTKRMGFGNVFACVTREELDAWLAKSELKLTEPVTHNERSRQTLAYA
jgi:hypothetical protein